jgi:ATP-dependent helicase/nuclease subunit B
MDAIAETHHADAALRALMSRVRELIEARGAHPARTLVLLPFAQLLPAARDAWAAIAPQGFLPRFETTATWSAAGSFVPGAEDFTGDEARDLLSARSLIESAGLAAHADLLAPRLVEAAGQLKEAAAAIEPGARRAWAARMREAIAPGFDAAVLSREAAVAAIAIEWIASSSFATDRLLKADLAREIELLVVVQGLREEPLANAMAGAIAARWPGKAQTLRLIAEGPTGRIALHEASDPADEAERAAACVLRHVREGRVPVALAAIDRVLTRRVRAMLDEARAAIRDETGWTLSTTRAAAHAMLALRAAQWNAGADAVIDWLKNSPAHAPGSVLALERRIRRAGIREWRALRPGDLGNLGEGQQQLLEQVNAWRDGMQAARPLPQWLADLRGLLQGTGQWQWLERDAAGVQVIAALRLGELDRAELENFGPARRRFSLAEFTAWANDALEAESFRPPAAAQAQVVILPLHQLVGRAFGALVLAGCDEVRLPASADLAGAWTPAQRRALGLPSREALQEQARTGWQQALRIAECDILWRAADESGEPVLASPLVQELELAGGAVAGADAREPHQVDARATGRPQPAPRLLPIERLSASAYEDLRRCPYRFFALRQLGLQEPDEIDVQLDKRDFGNWLHKVLSTFHTRLAAEGASLADRPKLLDAAAQSVTREMRLDDSEFLPFSAAWAQVREGYLAWLARHEAQGARFCEAEAEHEITVGPLKLFGRIDRLDALPDGTRMVMDYKTESLAVTQERVKSPGEDTQLAFYAALLGDEPLRAAYVNVGERGETRTVEQPDVARARELLLAGIAHDLQRIGEGAPLPALGEGKACEYCAARGLCRKDFWE